MIEVKEIEDIGIESLIIEGLKITITIEEIKVIETITIEGVITIEEVITKEEDTTIEEDIMIEGIAVEISQVVMVERETIVIEDKVEEDMRETITEEDRKEEISRAEDLFQIMRRENT